MAARPFPLREWSATFLLMSAVGAISIASPRLVPDLAVPLLPGGMAVVKAQAPLSEVMQYQSQLKSVTGGQGSFVMEFSHYEAVPPQVQQHIAAQYKPKTEEE